MPPRHWIHLFGFATGDANRSSPSLRHLFKFRRLGRLVSFCKWWRALQSGRDGRRAKRIYWFTGGPSRRWPFHCGCCRSGEPQLFVSIQLAQPVEENLWICIIFFFFFLLAFIVSHSYTQLKNSHISSMIEKWWVCSRVLLHFALMGSSCIHPERETDYGGLQCNILCSLLLICLLSVPIDCVIGCSRFMLSRLWATIVKYGLEPHWKATDNLTLPFFLSLSLFPHCSHRAISLCIPFFFSFFRSVNHKIFLFLAGV